MSAVMPKIVMFSGGTGTASIAKALIDKGADLTLVVNCYDDGKSTGVLRRLIPGMLGPSDIRKNVGRHSPFVGLLDKTYPNGMYHTTLQQHEDDSSVVAWIVAFMKFYHDAPQHPDLSTIPYGNIVFAGAYLCHDCDFNVAVDVFQKLFMCRARVLNVTNGENLFLEATREDGSVSDESAISTEWGMAYNYIRLFPPHLPEARGYLPWMNDEVQTALVHADMIVYGPGTQFSSLLPSYMTHGIGSTIAQSLAKKVYIANVARDFDIAPLKITLCDLLEWLKTMMELSGHIPPMQPLTDYVEYVVASGVIPLQPLRGPVRPKLLEGVELITGRDIVANGCFHKGPETAELLLGILSHGSGASNVRQSPETTPTAS